MRMDHRLKVLFTVDTEVWPETPNWYEHHMKDDIARDLDGSTPRGEFGVFYQAEMLRQHGLKGVFFAESLYTFCVGLESLKRTVDRIGSLGHEIGLHSHAEWLKRPGSPLPAQKNLMHKYNLDEQCFLISSGLEKLRAAGVGRVRSYRAGGFGANADTLTALARNGIPFDSSYNRAWAGTHCVIASRPMLQPELVSGVFEFPVAMFEDWPGHSRPAQLCAASSGEMIASLKAARQNGWRYFVIVSHSFELIYRGPRPAPDWVVIRRFKELCEFLAAHPSDFETITFEDIQPELIPPANGARPITAGAHHTAWRMAEQAYRRICAPPRWQ